MHPKNKDGQVEVISEGTVAITIREDKIDVTITDMMIIEGVVTIRNQREQVVTLMEDKILKISNGPEGNRHTEGIDLQDQMKTGIGEMRRHQVTKKSHNSQILLVIKMTKAREDTQIDKFILHEIDTKTKKR